MFFFLQIISRSREHVLPAPGKWNCCIGLCGLLFALIVGQILLPRVMSATVSVNGGTPRIIEHGSRIFEPSEEVEFIVTIDLPRWHPKQFLVRARGCITNITLDGATLKADDLCFENGGSGPLTIPKSIDAGTHQFLFSMRHADTVGVSMLHISPSARDPLMRIFHLSLFLSLIVLLSGLGILLYPRIPASLSVPIALGILLRVIILTATPIGERAFDWEGHLAYVQYIAEHWSLPAAQAGWETYQPPLYYVLAASWMKLMEPLGHPHGALQGFSLLLSIGTVVGIVWIGIQLFPFQNQKPAIQNLWGRDISAPQIQASIFTCTLALLPGLLMASARIGNDALLHPLLFLGFGMLLRAIHTERERDWMFFFITCALAILTKLNGFLLLGFGLIVLLLSEYTPRKKCTLICHDVGIVTLLTGWHFLLRYGIEGERSLIGNAERLNAILHVNTTAATLFSFSPLRILATPVIDHLAPNFPKAYALEYLFRSALGSYWMGPAVLHLQLILLMVGLLLLVFAIIGCVRSWKDPLHRVTMLLLPWTLALFLFYRILYPFASSQDFRYVPLLAVPIALAVILGIGKAERWWERLGALCLLLILIVSTWLPVVLYLQA